MSWRIFFNAEELPISELEQAVCGVDTTVHSTPPMPQTEKCNKKPAAWY
jgi:hypothetical protein